MSKHAPPDSVQSVADVLTPAPVLALLCHEALGPLKDAFWAALLGTDLRVVVDGEGEAILRVVVRAHADDLATLETALRRHGETWWRDNCPRSGGRLVFDSAVTW